MIEKVFNIVEKEGKAEITISGEIGYSDYWWSDEEKDSVSTKSELNKEIKSLLELNANTVVLKIDSLGGSVFHSTAMVNALKDTGKTIEVEYLGYTASAGTHFATIANKVIIPENVFLLIHEASSGAFGTAEEIAATAEQLVKINETLVQSYVAQSKRAGKNKDAEFFANLMKEAKGQGKWLSANELLEIGLVTDIKPVFNAINSYSKEILNRFGLPEFPTNIINKQKPKNMGIFDIFKGKTLNMVNFGEVSAVTDGALKKGSELQPVNGAELKNGTYELEGFTVEITDNKVTNYTKISEKTEAVNIADFKNEFSDLKAENESLKAQIVENTEATNKAIETLTNSVTNLVEKLNSLETEGSKVDIPKKEVLDGIENVEIDPNERLEERMAAKQREIDKQRNIL